MTADKNEGPFRYLTSIKDADCDPVVGIVRRASVARARTREQPRPAEKPGGSFERCAFKEDTNNDQVDDSVADAGR
jgi:hypothetical protein